MLVLKNGPLLFFYSIATDVSKNKFKKIAKNLKNGGYILFFEVLLYLRSFSCSPYVSLAYMCVTVLTKSNKYWYYAMYGTILLKRSFLMYMYIV
jgi:hypothetical protein